MEFFNATLTENIGKPKALWKSLKLQFDNHGQNI